MSNGALSLQIAIDAGAELDVVSATICEELSGRTRAVIEVACADDVDFARYLASRVGLVFSGMQERRFSLVLSGARYLAHRDNSFRHELELFDAAWLLGLSKTTRKFRNLSAQQIVAKVLAEGAVAHRFALTSATPVRKYCSQYRETNLAFVERLLELEGIFYHFDEDGTMVLGDASDARELIAASPFSLIEPGGALERGELGIHRFRRGSRTRAGRITLGDYNWKRPDLELAESASAARDTSLERYEFPAGYRLPDQGARLAALRLEAHRVEAEFVDGHSNLLRFAPGEAFLFGGAGDAMDGEYLLTRVQHRFNSGSYAAHAGPASGAADGKHSYENRFTGMPRKSKFRPMPKTPRPRIDGTHTAMVRGPEEVHTDEHGRFRAEFHWDLEGTGSADDSRWLRLVQETATSMTLARTGWEVFVGYIHADPDRPIGLGRAINAVAAPTFALPDNKTMMAIRTPSVGLGGGGGGGGGGSYNEITMKDAAGEQSIDIRAQLDLDAVVTNEKTEKIGHDEMHAVGTDFTRNVAKDQTVAIGGNATHSYGASHKLQIDGNRSKKVAGAETVKIGASAQQTIQRDEQERVGSLRLTVAGSLHAPNVSALTDGLKGIALGAVRQAAPGLAAAYDAARSIQGQAAGLGTAGAGLAGSASSAVSGAASAGANAVASGSNASGAGSAVASSLGGSVQGTVSSVLPSQQTLASLVPSESWLPTGASIGNAIDQAGQNAVSYIKQQLSIDAAIELCCSGGIVRTASASMFKIVGGAYVTVAVLGIGTHIGFGYIETIGGGKLTLARDAIRQDVHGKLNVLVGGAIRRHSAGVLIITTGVDSSVTATSASYDAGGLLELLSPNVEVSGSQSLDIKGGSAKLALDKGSATITGKMTLKAGKGITLFGGSKLNVTG